MCKNKKIAHNTIEYYGIIGICVMKIIKYAIIGICAGFITGFFSAGGGMLILPAIIYFLKMDEKKARATTIFIILPMVVTAAIFYYNDNLINISMGIKCAIGGIIGSFLGTKLLGKVSDKFLKIVFIMFLLYASYNMLK